jgi:hypothetical protein
MDLFAPLDLYCERTEAHLLSEPLNLISNLAFIIAGALILRKLGRPASSQRDSVARLLGWQIITVGLGSALFHSFATGWAQLCDIIPIGILILTYLWLFCRKLVDLTRLQSFLGLIVFLLVSVVMAWLSDPIKANGGQFYFGTWLTLTCLCTYVAGRQNLLQFKPMFMASVLFSFSILLRTIDLKFCEEWPFGTHLFWHLTNATVLYLVVNVLINSIPEDARTREG